MISYAMAVQGSHTPVIEPNDPLFIHPSDQPRQILVADAFSGEDFDSWKRTFLIALSSKNKVGFVDGTIARPTNDSPLLLYWQRCKDLVASWILNSLRKEISGSVVLQYCSRDVGRIGGKVWPVKQSKAVPSKERTVRNIPRRF